MSNSTHPGFSFQPLFKQVEDLKRGDLALIAPGGRGPLPPHQHNSAHLFVVLTGTIDVWIEQAKHSVNQHETIYVPANRQHTMHNPTQHTARVLGIELAGGGQ
ncbi:cupin domain-containing protein [Salinibius halmophilus]|uniref:cupin domain-containing protein n=1 Tax=Salinibius halmophilus TaxID=1853216 RepID=UPI000E663D6F|nr:cupin domain-containing protein [Salinibius halmophilus]